MLLSFISLSLSTTWVVGSPILITISLLLILCHCHCHYHFQSRTWVVRSSIWVISSWGSLPSGLEVAGRPLPPWPAPEQWAWWRSSRPPPGRSLTLASGHLDANIFYCKQMQNLQIENCKQMQAQSTKASKCESNCKHRFKLQSRAKMDLKYRMRRSGPGFRLSVTSTMQSSSVSHWMMCPHMNCQQSRASHCAITTTIIIIVTITTTVKPGAGLPPVLALLVWLLGGAGALEDGGPPVDLLCRPGGSLIAVMIAVKVVVRLIMLVNSNLETSTRSMTASPMSRDPTTTDDKRNAPCVPFFRLQAFDHSHHLSHTFCLDQLKQLDGSPPKWNPTASFNSIILASVVVDVEKLFEPLQELEVVLKPADRGAVQTF